MLAVSQREQALNIQFNMLATRMGFKNTRWARLVIIMFGIFAIGTSFICFQKADFLNLTLAICGLFILLDPQHIKTSYLRLLVLAIPVSQIYDLLWLFHKSTEYWDNKTEGGMDQLILLMVILMFFYKIILGLFMWKASLNF